MANEGAQVLEEGYAIRASDIDVVYVHGFGFPRHRGGPMFYADTVGLPTVLARVKEYRQQFGEYLASGLLVGETGERGPWLPRRRRMTVLALTELRGLVGQEVSISEWLVVTQERINAFADTTDDHQWIHVDQERATAETPFGTTIAHGFLTLSMLSAFMRNAVTIDGPRMTLNYGFNRVRFVSPVPSGSRIRARVVLGRVDDLADSTQVTWNITVEREGGDKPCRRGGLDRPLLSALTEGLRPSDSPTRSLARRFAGALRSRGSLAVARSRWHLFHEPTWIYEVASR